MLTYYINEYGRDQNQPRTHGLFLEARESPISQTKEEDCTRKSCMDNSHMACRSSQQEGMRRGATRFLSLGDCNMAIKWVWARRVERSSASAVPSTHAVLKRPAHSYTLSALGLSVV